MSHANDLPQGLKYLFAMASSRLGLKASAIALVLPLVGKGPVRLPALLASLGLAAYWVICCDYLLESSKLSFDLKKRTTRRAIEIRSAKRNDAPVPDKC
jgi:hypothetical protein